MRKKSFFERLTGSTPIERQTAAQPQRRSMQIEDDEETEHQLPQADEEGQLTIDMWQTPDKIMIQAIVGGVKPDDLDVTIARDMVTIKGKRTKTQELSTQDYFYQELFWGVFSRTILLPQEIDADEAEATFKNGLLTLHLPKLDKNKVQKIKVRNE